MDEIIAAVLKRLQARMDSRGQVDLAHDGKLEERTLLHHQRVTVTGVTQAQLDELTKRAEGPLVAWLDKAVAYGCDMTLVTAMCANGQWDPAMILNWPVTFTDKQGRRVYSFKEHIISASAIRTCNNGSVILIFRGQRFTALGLDELRDRHLVCIEGTKRYADW